MAIEFTTELCYFLGLITGRGRIYESNSNNRIIIEFPHKNKIQTGIPFCPLCKNGVVTNSKCKSCRKKTSPNYKVKIDQRKEVLNTINTILSPLILKLTQTRPDVSGTDVYTYLSIDFTKKLELFKFIKKQFEPYYSFQSFQIPLSIKELPENLKLEYLAGITDTAGFVRWGNWHPSGLTRVYIEIPNSNWKLPVQLCNFFQNEVNIPIQTIDWGHPNIRDGNMIEYSEGKLTQAFREHQLKIFTDQFENVPIKFTHKKQLFLEMISYNKKLGINSAKFCSPPMPIRPDKIKVIHGAENSDKLPIELRGKHFDGFWQVCWTMGCNRCEVFKSDPLNETIYLTGKTEMLSLECEENNINKIRENTTKKLKLQWDANKLKLKSRIITKKSSFSESDTYEPQKKWLQQYLEKKYPSSKIETFVVADSDMSSFFTKVGNDSHAKLMDEYDIRPDVVGIVDGKKIVFIESKITFLGIKEIGQLLGYCLVAEPELAILCSTKDSSGNLTTILPHLELFKFGNNKKIQCATWNQSKKEMVFF